MFKKNALEKAGIKVLEKLEDTKIIDIVGQVSTRLVTAYPNSNLSYLDIYKTLLDTPMFYAEVPEGLSKANYYYKDSSIYFSKDIDFTEIDEYVLHECLHRLQERRDKKGKLTRIGVCEVNELTVRAAALNEAAIQYVTANAFNKPKKLINIYGIEIPSKTDYYPIITNLVSQLAYLLGENVLVDSTINGREDFKIEIIDNIGESEYRLIEKNTNEILNLKKDIFKLQKENMTEKEIANVENNIQEIRQIYFDTQNMIFTSYFNNIFKRIENESDVSLVKEKLEKYKELIGKTEGYNFFENYYSEFENKLKEKAQEIKNRTPLMVIKDNMIFKMVRRIKIWYFQKLKPNHIK